MKPICYPICIYQGASWILEGRFRAPDGTLLDMTNYVGQMDIRRSPRDDTPILRLSSTTGGIVFAAVEPNIVLRISATQTADLPTNDRRIENWSYDLKIWQNTDPDYTTIRLLQGNVIVEPSITRVEPVAP